MKSNIVVIITINYRQNSYTINAIKSILENSYRNFHLIIIDNGPDYNEHKKLCNEVANMNDQRLHILKSDKNLGYVGGVNFGFMEGMKFRPDYFLIMNNDTILDKDAIEALVSCSKNFNNNAIVTGKVYHFDQPNKLQYIGSKCIDSRLLSYEWIGKDQNDNGQFNQIAERDMIDDIFWMIPIKIYNILGNYSTDFYFNGESSDYCLRAHKNKFKLIYTPYAKLWHKGSISIGGRIQNPETAYWILQSALVLRYLHINSYDFKRFFINKLFEKIIKRFIIAMIKIFKGNLKDFKILKANIKAFQDFYIWKKTKNPSVWQPPFFKA
jgi:GT2 family glycosyltransferase